jgi:quercetin dioxygenase-like cupin family protein
MDVKQLQSFAAFGDDKLKKHNLFETDRFFLDVYCLKPGQAQKAHAHPDSDKVYVVIEGQCEASVGAEKQNVAEGAAVFCPAGSEHGVFNNSNGNVRLLVMMTPPPKKS